MFLFHISDWLFSSLASGMRLIRLVDHNQQQSGYSQSHADQEGIGDLIHGIDLEDPIITAGVIIQCCAHVKTIPVKADLGLGSGAAFRVYGDMGLLMRIREDKKKCEADQYPDDDITAAHDYLSSTVFVSLSTAAASAFIAAMWLAIFSANTRWLCVISA
jgi:hypothetical protein